MQPVRAALLTTACLLAACSDSAHVLASPDGRLRVLAECRPDQLADTIRQHGRTAVVVAFADDVGAIPAAAGAGERTPLVVAVGNEVDRSGRQPDVMVIPDQGGEIAIAIALLVQAGIEVPDSAVAVGARVLTPANRAAGGTPHAGPGDAILALWRMQHARALTPDPAADAIGRFGLIRTSTDLAWQARVAAAARAEADRFPQLELVLAEADERPTAAATRMVSNGCRVVLAITADPAIGNEIAEAAKQASEQAQVVVLDPMLTEGHDGCHVGCAANVIGKAIDGQLKMLLPDGGDLVLCTDDTPVCSYQRDGVVEFLQLTGKR